MIPQTLKKERVSEKGGKDSWRSGRWKREVKCEREMKWWERGEKGRTGWAGDLNQALNRAQHCITHCSLVRTQMQLNALIWLDVDLEDRYLLFYKCHCGVLTLCFKLVSFLH